MNKLNTVFFLFLHFCQIIVNEYFHLVILIRKEESAASDSELLATKWLDVLFNSKNRHYIYMKSSRYITKNKTKKTK